MELSTNYAKYSPIKYNKEYNPYKIWTKRNIYLHKETYHLKF